MDDDQLDDEDRAIIQQMQELAAKMLVPGLSLSECEAIGKQIEELHKKLKPKAWEFEAFALQLMAKQGTYMQDFQAFYRKRAELDQRLLGPDEP